MLFLNKLIEHQKICPQSFALADVHRKLSYGELAGIVKNGADYLASEGVLPGAVVGISISNEIDHMLASLSLLALGTIQVTLASHDSYDVRNRIATNANVNFLVIDNEAFELEDIHVLKWTTGGFYSSKSHPTFNEAHGRLFLSTSGTTGKSNLILFTEEQISLQAMRHQDYKDERLLRLASVEYNASKRHRLYSLWNGGENFFRPSGNISDVIKFAAANHISYLDISRLHVRELIALNNPSLFLGMSIRTGGAEVPNDLRKSFLSNVSESLYVRYATTETGAIAMATPQNHNDDATSGFPVINVDIEVVDGAETVLEKGQVGEIRVRAPGMATEYYDNIAQTQLRFRGGWFYPNDMGYIREDGQLVIKGRKDDMINLNGINIFPADIEQVLESHFAVKRAVALGIDSCIHGQIPVAAVELIDESLVSEVVLMDFARAHLALRYPRRIKFVENMPINHQGKILRHEIKKLFVTNSKSINQ
jgi:long-chain acyl-CoA synthetase